MRAGVLFLVLASCSAKSGSSAPPGAQADGGPSSDAAPGYAAGFKADVGQIVDNGGPTLKSAKIVTVTWTADPNEASLEDFGDKLGASAFWKDTVAEYGIGPATSGAANHVRIQTAPPATMDNGDLDVWITGQLTDTTTSGWPAPQANSIYVVYVPTAMQLTSHDVYHGELTVGANAHVAYVVVDENANDGKPVLDAATANASHEIAETATNPHVFSDVAVVGFDPTHVAWQMMVSDAEIGDVCEKNANAIFKGPADLPYALQRLWSNKAATAGHDPCVPAPTEPYYGVTPLDLETISVFVNDAQSASTGLGYRIGIGEKKTIKVGFFSDQAIDGPWTISAVEGNWFSPASNHRLTVSVDKTSGKNGDTATITVTANTQSTGLGNAVLVTVTSQAPGLAPHAVPILIGTY